jgi:hypothetical protein
MSETMTTGARVYLQTPRRRGYLAAVIAPLAQHLASEFGAHEIHLYPGWRFGPHFDLRARAHPGRAIGWEGVARALASGAGNHEGANEGGRDDDAAYVKTAILLGRIEGVPGPYLPRRPHGHTELLAPEASPVWQRRLGALRARGLAHLMAPLTHAAAAESDGAVLAKVAEAFVALGDVHPHGLRFGTFSFRSHAEAFFQWAGPSAAYRSSFENRLEKDRAVLEELVRRVRDRRESAAATQWRRAFHACLDEFAGQVTDEDLDQATAHSGVPERRGDGPSAFHRAVGASGVIDETPEWFAGYRLTINLFYQLLPALDVSPVRRFYLCHAIAESVDAVFGETWQSRLDAVQAHLAALR